MAEKAKHVMRQYVILIALSVLAGCTPGLADFPPTLIPVANAPDLPVATTPDPLTPAGQAITTTERTAITAASIAREPVAEFIPAPVNVGVRPGQAQQYWAPDAGPAAPAEWRPPPYVVPLSLHPDDHYWLIRPIPSNRRNYDLEWYPYGNDVLLPELAPYRIHHGLDFPNERGTPVLAAGSGTVIHAGSLPSPRDGVNYYGNTVIIQHDWQWLGQDVFTLYAHTLELFVTVGDYVEQGQLIAGVGSSGEVSGPHLHLEVRIGRNIYGDTRNPALWLAPYEGWGTLAGRVVDRKGRMIPGATITLEPVNVNTPKRIQRTYDFSVRSDEMWRENFVVADLPAGRYTLFVNINGILYRHNVEIFPGRTTFDITGAEFEFVPTPTPEPTATLEATPTVTPEP